MTAKPYKYPQGTFNPKSCKRCSAVFAPQAPSHLYCSQVCADDTYTERYLKRCYSISLAEYRRMFEEQQNRCKICGGVGFKIDHTTKSLLAVDHCHKTGKVRGLLCHNCNRALGLFHDDVERIIRAAEYVKSATTIPTGSTH